MPKKEKNVVPFIPPGVKKRGIRRSKDISHKTGKAKAAFRGIPANQISGMNYNRKIKQYIFFHPVTNKEYQVYGKNFMEVQEAVYTAGLWDRIIPWWDRPNRNRYFRLNSISKHDSSLRTKEKYKNRVKTLQKIGQDGRPVIIHRDYTIQDLIKTGYQF